MTVLVSKKEADLAKLVSQANSGQFGNQISRASSPEEYFRITGNTGRKNLVINGDCRVKQRTPSSILVDTDPSTPNLIDGWRVRGTASAGTYTLSQTTDGPPQFPYTVKATVNTADTTMSPDEKYAFGVAVEGYNFANAGWGTAFGKPVTISFWVKSNVASPNHSIGFMNRAATAGFAFEYGIEEANVWEHKKVTVMPTNMGVWDIDSNIALQIWWNLGVGSGRTIPKNYWYADNAHASDTQVNLMAVSGNYIQVTGVQLEFGTVATPFENRTYQEELALCQRYFQAIGGQVSYQRFGMGYLYSSTGGYFTVPYKVTMRAAPSLSYNGTFRISNGSGTNPTVTSLAVDQAGIDIMSILVAYSAASGYGAGLIASLEASNDSQAKLFFSAEY